MPVLLWTQKQDVGPQPRVGAAAAYDATRGRVVLFGGTALPTGPFADTWEWDGADWTQVADTGPDARSGHQVAYDSARSRVVLFGGRGGDGTLRADTWEWDGETWTQTADTGPDARTDLQLAFDATRAQTVLFGGLAAADALRADTWLWDGNAWTQAQDTGPSARRAHAMTFDSARSAVVLFGGEAAASVAGDTWEWDGATWTQRAHFGAPASASSGLVFDGTVSLLYGGIASLKDPNAKVFAGSWQWDGAHWTQRQDIGPGPRLGFALAFDSGRGCAVLFGGVTVSELDTTAPGHVLGDTWEEQGSGPAAQLASLSVNPDTVAPGGSTTIEAGLSQRAPAGGAIVAVSGAAGLPAIDVAGGATSGSATYTVAADATPGDVVLTAKLAGSSATATLHVATAGATIASFTIAPTTMPTGNQQQTLTFTVTLTEPAATAVSVPISYQGGNVGTLTVPQGTTSGQLQIQVSGVPAGTYVFDATLGSQDLTATLTVA